MENTYKELKEMLERNLKTIVKKGDISKEDLCSVKEATSALEHINHLMGSQGQYYSEGMSYGVNRSPVTGRYISNGVHGVQHYSGHSIKDRMIACLEPMYDQASSEYERQMISNTINRIRTEN